LGAYIADEKKQFIFDIEKNKRADILLDEDRLIIFLSEPDKLIELPLTKFAEKIGRNRYRVNYSTFLNGCLSKNDIRIKIQLFKDKIADKLPAIWNDFFEKALLKARPLEALDDITIYRVSANDEELLHFFSTDAEISKYILRAENYHIAIKKDDFDKVKQILENQGYLV
ncbi:hypothetical protein KKA14_21980, partial [bacterium]|nr:hypothetical protein [bacterium]